MSVYSSPQSSLQPAPPAVAVLIVTYEPGRALLDLVEPLVVAGTSAILIVDDGSSPARRWVLDRLAQEPTVHLLRNTAPQGRGAALKTGMQYFLDHLSHYSGLVTVSPDGGYAADDVLRIARALRHSPTLAIVGAREFVDSGFGGIVRGSHRSLADRVLSVVFRAFTGIALADVQTRLRALPTGLLPRLLRIPGCKYDYEIAMLLHIARSGYPLAEHTVPARQHSVSPESGFRPVADSVSVVRAMLNCTPVPSFAPERGTAEAAGSTKLDSLARASSRSGK